MSKKHGVSFELAATVFDDPLHLSVLDSKKHIEERWITVGQCAEQKTIVVVHLYKNKGAEEEIRIISARKATPKEKRQYEERI